MKKLLSLLVVSLLLTIMFNPVHSKNTVCDQTAKLICYYGNKTEEKQILINDALTIHEKIEIIGEKSSEEKKILIGQLIDFLDDEDIISIPQHDLQSGSDGENFSYNMFCTIYGTSYMMINVLLRHVITQFIPQLFVLSVSVMPHVIMGASLYLCISGEIETTGMAGEWGQNGTMLGVMLGFIGIKLVIPPPFSPPEEQYVIFGSCATIFSILLPVPWFNK